MMVTWELVEVGKAEFEKEVHVVEKPSDWIIPLCCH